MNLTQLQSENLEQFLTDDALLTYGANTDPLPVQASASLTDLSVATLTIVVSCSEVVESATVRQLLVTIPSDPASTAQTDPPQPPPDPTNLAAVAPTVATITSSGTDVWTPSAGIAPGSFVFTPTGGPIAVSSQSLTITIPSIKVSTLTGTAIVTVSEWASQDPDDPPPITGPASGTATIPISKFPQGFTVSKFEATTPAIGPDYGTTVSWAGSNDATYTIQYGETIIPNPSDPKAKKLPPQGSQTIAELIDDPTVFTLTVTAQVNGANLSVQRQAVVSVERAKILNFVVWPDTIAKGGSCHITWETNGDSVALQDQTFDGPNGSTDLTITESTSLTLTAMKGEDMTQQTRSVTVEPQSIKSFTATMNGAPITGPIEAGTAVTLSWTTGYASSVAIAPGVSGTLPVNGSTTVTPADNTTYVLTVSGFEPDLTQSIPIAVIPVSISSFTVQPSSVDPGNHQVTLAWVTSRATSATIDQGVGTVTPAAKGSVQTTVNAQSDVQYTLSCDGPNGPVSTPVTLHVNCVRIDQFTNGYDYTDANGVTFFKLNWVTELATDIRLAVDQDGILNGYAANVPRDVGPNGQLDFEVYEYMSGATFTLTAWGPGISPISAQTKSPTTD